MPFVTVQSNDGTLFKVDVNVLSQSITLKTMLENLGIGEEDNEDDVVPLPNVNSFILSRILEWCSFHRHDPIPTADDATSTIICGSDKLLFKEMDQATLFEMILASNYLEIRSLSNVLCKTVANMLDGKTANRIRLGFNIKNDFTPEEEKKIRDETDIDSEIHHPVNYHP